MTWLSHYFESFTVATVTWLKSLLWKFYSRHHNSVEVITLKVLVATMTWLKSLIWKFYSRHHDLVESLLWKFYSRHHDLVEVITLKVLQSPSWLGWSHYFESFTVATMTWLTVMKSLCHRWPRICSICCNHNPVLSSFMTCNWIATRVTQWVPHVEQELLTTQSF
jgi:phage tail protein X